MITIDTFNTHFQDLTTDVTITCPIEIHLYDNGIAVAVYEGQEDVLYHSLADLLAAHTIDEGEFVRQLDDKGDQAASVVVTAALIAGGGLQDRWITLRAWQMIATRVLCMLDGELLELENAGASQQTDADDDPAAVVAERHANIILESLIR